MSIRFSSSTPVFTTYKACILILFNDIINISELKKICNKNSIKYWTYFNPLEIFKKWPTGHELSHGELYEFVNGIKIILVDQVYL
jgi:hypothetical protein